MGPNIENDFPLSKSARRKQRDRDLKESNPDEWERRRKMKNEKRRERREKMKMENPEEYQKKVSQESARRQKKRIHIIEETPEEHMKFLEREKEFRKNVKIKMWNDIFDSLFEENKSTFPTPISKKLWESLKKTEIDMYFSEFNGDISVSFLNEMRQDNLEILQKNPNHPLGGSIIFYIKTLVHFPRDRRIITAEEQKYINSLVLSPLKDETKKYEYYEKKKEYYKEKSKLNYENKKSDAELYKLNFKFIAADPNKVLSLDDICNNPFISNFSDREEFKINLYKNLKEDEKPEFLEKWKKQREIYENEVKSLSEDYKKEFLKIMGKRDYFDEWEKRKEKYLDHFRTK